MAEIVWRVRNDITGEEIANFLARSGEPRDYDARGASELAAIELARELNATASLPATFLVSRGILVRDHKIPALRNVVI